MPSETENPGGSVFFRPAAGDTQTAPRGITWEPVGLHRDMEDCRHASGGATSTPAGPEPHLGVGSEGMGKSTAVSKAARGDSRGGGRRPSQVGPPLVKYGGILLRGWYREAKKHAPLPAHVTISWMMEDRVELYRRFPPLGRSTPLAMYLFPMDDLVPEEDDMAGAICRL